MHTIHVDILLQKISIKLKLDSETVFTQYQKKIFFKKQQMAVLILNKNLTG